MKKAIQAVITKKVHPHNTIPPHNTVIHSANTIKNAFKRIFQKEVFELSGAFLFALIREIIVAIKIPIQINARIVRYGHDETSNKSAHPHRAKNHHTKTIVMQVKTSSIFPKVLQRNTSCKIP